MLHRHARGRSAALAVLFALTLGALGAGSAVAADAVPSFNRCPVSNPDVRLCIVDLSTGGYLKINNTTVPLGDSIRIDGGFAEDPTNFTMKFVPPTSGSALTAKPVEVPGGLLGIPLPLGFDTVKATAKLVGPMKVDFTTLALSMPIKIELDNPLLGSDCQIGATLFPIKLNTITGTTAPPPPNTPITGKIGALQQPDENTLEGQGNVNVDNSFSVPIAINCGYLTGILVTTAVNLKIGLPSPAGRNTAVIEHNLFIRPAALVRNGTV